MKNKKKSKMQGLYIPCSPKMHYLYIKSRHNIMIAIDCHRQTLPVMALIQAPHLYVVPIKQLSKLQVTRPG